MACRDRPNHFWSLKDGLVGVTIIWVIISGVSSLVSVDLGRVAGYGATSQSDYPLNVDNLEQIIVPELC